MDIRHLLAMPIGVARQRDSEHPAPAYATNPGVGYPAVWRQYSRCHLNYSPGDPGSGGGFAPEIVTGGTQEWDVQRVDERPQQRVRVAGGAGRLVIGEEADE